jgi:hypothetical protein
MLSLRIRIFLSMIVLIIMASVIASISILIKNTTKNLERNENAVNNINLTSTTIFPL